MVSVIYYSPRVCWRVDTYADFKFGSTSILFTAFYHTMRKDLVLQIFV